MLVADPNTEAVVAGVLTPKAGVVEAAPNAGADKPKLTGVKALLTGAVLLLLLVVPDAPGPPKGEVAVAATPVLAPLKLNPAKPPPLSRSAAVAPGAAEVAGAPIAGVVFAVLLEGSAAAVELPNTDGALLAAADIKLKPPLDVVAGPDKDRPAKGKAVEVAGALVAAVLLAAALALGQNE